MIVLLATLLPLVPLSSARVVNVTIDDTYGDAMTGLKVQYLPPNAWGTMTDFRDVSAGVDVRNLHNGTCASNFARPGNMTLTFNGTMIYVFYTFVAVSLAPLRFYLDLPAPPAVIQLQGPADNEGTEIVYNHLAFQSGRLLYGEHTLLVASVSDQQFCFDYAVYSTDRGEGDSPEIHESDTVPQIPSASISLLTTDTGTVTGRPAKDSAPARFDARAVAGAVAAVAAAIIAIAAWWCIRRARRRARAAAEEDRPAVFMAQPDPSLAAPAEKEHRTRLRDAAKPPRDDITPFVSQPERAEPAGGSKNDKPRGMPSEITGENSETQVERERGGGGTADVRAELARVRAENERARREIEMLRQAAEPPPYPRSESGGETMAR